MNGDTHTHTHSGNRKLEKKEKKKEIDYSVKQALFLWKHDLIPNVELKNTALRKKKN